MALRKAVEHLGGAVLLCCIHLRAYRGRVVGADLVVAHTPWPGSHIALIKVQADWLQTCWEVRPHWGHDNANGASAAPRQELLQHSNMGGDHEVNMHVFKA